jgi:hypothetical protein
MAPLLRDPLQKKLGPCITKWYRSTSNCYIVYIHTSLSAYMLVHSLHREKFYKKFRKWNRKNHTIQPQASRCTWHWVTKRWTPLTQNSVGAQENISHTWNWCFLNHLRRDLKRAEVNTSLIQIKQCINLPDFAVTKIIRKQSPSWEAPQLLTKYPVFYGTGRFIIVFARAKKKVDLTLRHMN